MRTSIDDPEASRVRGFASKMPAGYGDQLSAAELDTLVKYLLRVAGEGTK